jgi:hypothetical protein
MTVVAFALLASACSVDIERNADGSLQLAGEVTAESMATEFERDPKNDAVDVTIDDGVMWLDIEGTDENGEYVANLRVELGVEDGAPAVDITEAFYNGWTVPDEIRDEFNQAIEKEIRKAVKQNPDAQLLLLTADDGRIVTEWRIETKDSRNG